MSSPTITPARYDVVDVGYETPCHIWKGAKNNHRYAMVRVLVEGRSKTRLAHVVAYEEAVGLVPAGLELDHLCRQTLCVNPVHVEPVTHRENMRRAYGDTCKRGHALSGENLYVLPDGRRRCRTCHALRERSRKAKQKEAS